MFITLYEDYLAKKAYYNRICFNDKSNSFSWPIITELWRISLPETIKKHLLPKARALLPDIWQIWFWQKTEWPQLQFRSITSCNSHCRNKDQFIPFTSAVALDIFQHLSALQQAACNLNQLWTFCSCPSIWSFWPFLFSCDPLSWFSVFLMGLLQNWYLTAQKKKKKNYKKKKRQASKKENWLRLIRWIGGFGIVRGQEVLCWLLL